MMIEAGDSTCRVRVLAVSPFESDHTTLTHIFGHTSWEVESAHNLLETTAALLTNPPHVVLCEQTLPDGTWKDVLALAGTLGSSFHLIVTSQYADDRLWSEVLNVGAYDVLAKPFQSREVFHSVGLAWRQLMDMRKQTVRASSRTQALMAGAVA